MLKTTLKLFFFVYFFGISIAFCQKKSISRDYNKWLQKIHLDTILEATEPLNGIQGDRHLILKAKEPFNDPLLFAGTWKYIRNQFSARGINIDSALLNKVALLNFLLPESVSVDLMALSNEKYHVKISYRNKQLAIDETSISMRGHGYQIDLDFEAASTFLTPTCIQTNEYQKFTDFYKKLKLHFMGYRHFAPDKVTVSLQPKSDNSDWYTIIISNIFHQIVSSGNYHEAIVLNVKLQGNLLCYSIDGSYAPGGRQTPDLIKDTKLYSDISNDFPADWIRYINNFPGELKAISNGK